MQDWLWQNNKILPFGIFKFPGEPRNQEAEEDQDDNDDDDEDFDWQIEQTLYTDEDTVLKVDAPTYGFANRRSGVFQRLQVKVYFCWLIILI